MNFKFDVIKIVTALTTASLAATFGSNVSHSFTLKEQTSQASNFEKRVENVREQLKTRDKEASNTLVSEAESRKIDRQIEQRWCDQRWCDV
jgi:L-cystine uptake protein TcyP (sodium:dicarboxylate symporter family)